jgi:thymidylate kinase
MTRLLSSAFDGLEQNNIPYCLLRDFDQIDEMAASGGEIDLLVDRDQWKSVCSCLTQIGFVYMRAWGHAPHHFFIAYDKGSECWIKLDVVTEIAYGKRNHALRTELAINCLNNRKHHAGIFIPSPEDEFVTLLLHCVLDKEEFAFNRRKRLINLSKEIGNIEYLSNLLEEFWSPAISWSRLKTLVEEEQWKALLAERREVAAYLVSGDEIGVFTRRMRSQVLRKLYRLLEMFRPQLPMVAFLAPDGAGKTTLTASIQSALFFPVYSVYMGLHQKGTVTAKPSRIPGLGFVRRLLTQWQRYLLARYHQGRGRLVIFDRYTYDSLLPSHRQLNWGQRSRRWIMAHACPAPDLVILLDAPGEVLYQRKGEHSPAVLEQQRQAYHKLRALVPQMVILDATQDPEEVQRDAIALIWEAYLTRNANSRPVTLVNLVNERRSPAQYFDTGSK